MMIFKILGLSLLLLASRFKTQQHVQSWTWSRARHYLLLNSSFLVWSW